MNSATFPVRCTSCNKVIAQYQAAFEKKLGARMRTAQSEKAAEMGTVAGSDGNNGSNGVGETEQGPSYEGMRGAVLDDLNISRACCRKDFITHYPWDAMALMYKESCEAMGPWKLFSDGKVTHLPSAASRQAAAAAAAATDVTNATAGPSGLGGPVDLASARAATNHNGGAHGGVYGGAHGGGGSASAPALPRAGARVYLAR